MRNALIVLSLIVLISGGVGYTALRTYGLVADRAPGRLETAIARRVVGLSIPAAARRMRNPNPPASDAWRAGAAHFQEHCAVCHGENGRGQSEFGSKMYPPVPDLASPAIQAMSDGALFAIIQNGVRWTGMPAFRSEHTPEETWKLVSFVRRVPRLTPEDLRLSNPEAEADSYGTTVSMDGTAFTPVTLTVKVGDTVTWINKDPFPHNVTSAAGGFHSTDLVPDARWQFHATRVGTFPYACTLHRGMKGILVVSR